MTQKKKNIDQQHLQNSMSDLVSGIVPPSAKGVVYSSSKNLINSTATLAANVRKEFITSNRSLLSLLYQQFGLVQSVIEVPVLDAFRGGVIINAYEKSVVPENKPKKKFFSLFNAKDATENKTGSNSDDFNLELLKRRDEWERQQNPEDKKAERESDKVSRKAISAEELRKIYLYLEREDIWGKYKEALFWKRLFGGAGLVILDGRNPSLPLDLNKIDENTPLEFYPADNWELSASVNELQSIDWLSDTPFMLMGHKIHKSRVLVEKGKQFPSLYRSVGRGWGMSIMESLVRTVNKGIKNENVIFELQDEAKVDVFRLQDFNDSMMDPMSTDAVKKRITLSNSLKNYMRAIVIDSQDEYNQKQIHFNGLADLKQDNRVDMASDARINMTKLYGTTPAGFNSGEADRDSYADSVEAEIRVPAVPNMIKLLEVIGKKVTGKILDFDIQWKPLIRASEYELEKVKTLKLANLNEANIWGRLSNSEWTEAVNKAQIFDVDVSYKDKFIADPLAKQVFNPGFGGK